MFRIKLDFKLSFGLTYGSKLTYSKDKVMLEICFGFKLDVKPIVSEFKTDL